MTSMKSTPRDDGGCRLWTGVQGGIGRRRGEGRKFVAKMPGYRLPQAL